MCGSDYTRFTDGRKSINTIISDSKIWAQKQQKFNKGIEIFRVCVMVDFSNTRYLTDYINID